MKIIIASHKFNPSHLSHIIALTKIYEDNGFDVFHRVSKKYIDFQPDVGLRYFTLYDLRTMKKGDAFLIYAPSLSALIESFILRLTIKPLLIYFLHEPFTGMRSYLNAGFGILKVIKISIAALIAHFNSLISDTVVLSSTRAFKFTTESRLDLTKFKKINLLFLDESKFLINSSSRREYIAYIGTIAEDHAFGDFVRLVYECVISGRVVGKKFLIATKSKIPNLLEDKINFCSNAGYLTVVSGVPMTNSEINSYYLNSIVVWNAYKRSMQSGVLPKSYMFGTPIINCNLNKSEYFINEIHGAIIDDSYTLDGFISAIEMVESNFNKFSANCRDFYLNNFDAASQSKAVLSIIGNKYE
jgi:hypothetical protein